MVTGTSSFVSAQGIKKCLPGGNPARVWANAVDLHRMFFMILNRQPTFYVDNKTETDLYIC
jgi:hypothetical protein